MQESRLRSSLRKRDKYGAELHPGDVCVWCSKSGGIICIYIGGTTGNSATGRYGRFLTPIGQKSVAYKNVVVAYDSMGNRVVNHDITKELMRKYYG